MHLVRYPDTTISLPLQYFGSVAYFAAMAAFGRVILRDDARYDKRFKSAHRMDIVDTHGPVSLTVPVSHRAPADGTPRHAPTWHDIGISQHGRWWHVTALTLASAYGRTPFFEFYIDRLMPYFSDDTSARYGDIATLDVALTRHLAEIIGIEGRIVAASELGERLGSEVVDGKVFASALPQPPYYQVRADRYGFVASLSILDLLFNLGPETPLHLSKLISMGV